MSRRIHPTPTLWEQDLHLGPQTKGGAHVEGLCLLHPPAGLLLGHGFVEAWNGLSWGELKAHPPSTPPGCFQPGLGPSRVGVATGFTESQN